MIYLDNNATTPIAPPVLAAIAGCMEQDFGNPSSSYAIGRQARKKVTEARESVAEMIGAASAEEVVFTSGGTESDNWAILGALRLFPEKRRIITTRVEHEAVRKLCQHLEDSGYQLIWLDVGSEGEIDLDQLKEAVTDDTAIVSIMMANNETGVIFPVQEAAQIVKERSEALFHVDAVNAAGKIPIELAQSDIDLLSISAHKFHGPKGIGALYVKGRIDLPSMLVGGSQEAERRPGTEAVHQIVGMGAAARFASDLSSMKPICELRDHLEARLLAEVANSSLNGTADPASRLPNTSNISFANTNGEMILSMLDDEGICVSTGSACNSESRTASPVLQAMNVPYIQAMGSIRFSLGRYNSYKEIEEVIVKLPPIVNKIRSFAL